MLRLLREYVRPHAGRLIWAAVFMALVAATTGLNAWLLEPAIDKVFVEQVPDMLIWVPLVLVAVACLRGGATYLQSILMHGVGQRIIAETQVKMYRHLIGADLAYLHSVHSGQLLSSFLYDANLLRDAVGRAITGIAKDALTAVALAVVMFIQDWQLALIVVLIFPLVGVAIRKLGKRMRKASTATQEETGRLASQLSETLDGVRLVKAYGMEDGETERIRARIERRLKEIMRGIRTRSAATPLTEALGGVAVAMAIFYGGWRAQQGVLSLGEFMSFLAALLMAYQPLKGLASLNTALQEGLAAAQRIFAILDVAPSISEKPDATALVVQQGAITYTDVHFSYDGETAALHGIDIAVAPGSTVALVGPSGSGKTTLMNLLPRFYDPDSGRVQIDGQDLQDVTIASLRAATALVSQDITLFDDTVAANIAYGRSGASEAEITAAARAAAAHDFITALPQGYDAMVGENGVRLSGGQRQRIAIARAMLKDAPILLLDEATSALDSEAEREVQTALDALKAGRTTLVIAHRLSTVMAADRIYVLDGGKVVESGDHGTLLAQGGTYARLYRLQFAEHEAGETPEDKVSTRLGS
ncbi:MAG: ATP-binding cassette domain-containing protein [Rhodospirillaceae bacterium]|jgi:ATP-binding cassette, subfamily B, bacterial MsbA|nr:ATP-binding cassette domain-containing protein [Rhodospirillaceae bacterium]MBT3494720.1 ATP-binding cassette domain-containing protein [Rhodospirillaceae bacterium]MBT3779075.1 ATP-binding cassette domain-containing protein [Rhodospirillaceae bacterium]MBT3976620.1 ATP-binding cassette domain-containing protein [Rhodospirillaceae bacterium]MBT4168715.1 ATP-binding cassette domain-containing protein [Rhodospirillaceae bacterium]